MKPRLPPLGALRAFEAAARLGRMTAAAEELCVSPGAISRQVRLLEEHLGMAMFDGSKARPTLTPAARTLQPVLTTAFQQIQDTVRELRDDQQKLLDVACFSTFTVKWLIPRLFAFHAQHPGIEVRLRAIDTETDAVRQGCDLLITAEDGGSPQNAKTAWTLFTEQLGPVMAPALIQRQGVPQQVSDLARYSLLHTRTRRNAWDMWAASADARWPAMDSAAGPTYEHYYFTLEAAVQGLGVAAAPWHLVMDDVKAGRLVAPFGFTESGYDYVVHLRGADRPPLHAFCEWLRAQARAMPPPGSALPPQ
jgi:DNA-binding transcriptional LysR family regulator